MRYRAKSDPTDHLGQQTEQAFIGRSAVAPSSLPLSTGLHTTLKRWSPGAEVATSCHHGSAAGREKVERGGKGAAVGGESGTEGGGRGASQASGGRV